MDKHRNLEKVAEQLGAEAAALGREGDMPLAQGIVDRMEVCQRRARELEQAVKENRFFGIHGREEPAAPAPRPGERRERRRAPKSLRGPRYPEVRRSPFHRRQQRG
jgi:hypothetical protein